MISVILETICQGIQEEIQNEYLVYPNPASDFVKINNANDTLFTLFRMDVRQIMKTNTLHDHYKMNVAGFAKGDYVLILKGKADIPQQKLSIQQLNRIG